jgi:hypothetical protein
MKPLFWIGLVVLILGIASFVVAVPQRETHGISVGDASVGVTTKSSHKVSPVIGGLLCAVGAVLMIGGARRG